MSKRSAAEIIGNALAGVFPSYRQLQRDTRQLIGTIWVLQNTVQLLEGVLNRAMNEPPPTLDELPEEYRERARTLVRDHLILIAGEMFAKKSGVVVSPSGVAVDMGELEIAEASVEEVKAAVAEDEAELEKRRLEAEAKSEVSEVVS